jgi:hypothetical protein
MTRYDLEELAGTVVGTAMAIGLSMISFGLARLGLQKALHPDKEIDVLLGVGSVAAGCVVFGVSLTVYGLTLAFADEVDD